MGITIEELSKITNVLLNYVEQKGYKTISFKDGDSYYQKIWHDDRNLNSTPKIGIGMLDDDIEELKKILQGESPFEYDLERLGAIFTAVGAILAKK